MLRLRARGLVEDLLLKCGRSGNAVSETAADALDYRQFGRSEAHEDMLEQLGRAQDNVARIRMKVSAGHGVFRDFSHYACLADVSACHDMITSLGRMLT